MIARTAAPDAATNRDRRRDMAVALVRGEDARLGIALRGGDLRSDTALSAVSMPSLHPVFRHSHKHLKGRRDSRFCPVNES